LYHRYTHKYVEGCTKDNSQIPLWITNTQHTFAVNFHVDFVARTHLDFYQRQTDSVLHTILGTQLLNEEIDDDLQLKQGEERGND